MQTHTHNLISMSHYYVYIVPTDNLGEDVHACVCFAVTGYSWRERERERESEREREREREYVRGVAGNRIVWLLRQGWWP